MLISCAVTMQLICAFVFVNAKSRFSHGAAHFMPSRLHKEFEHVRLMYTPRTPLSYINDIFLIFALKR